MGSGSLGSDNTRRRPRGQGCSCYLQQFGVVRAPYCPPCGLSQCPSSPPPNLPPNAPHPLSVITTPRSLFPPFFSSQYSWRSEETGSVHPYLQVVLSFCFVGCVIRCGNRTGQIFSPGVISLRRRVVCGSVKPKIAAPFKQGLWLGRLYAALLRSYVYPFFPSLSPPTCLSLIYSP